MSASTAALVQRAQYAAGVPDAGSASRHEAGPVRQVARSDAEDRAGHPRHGRQHEPPSARGGRKLRFAGPPRMTPRDRPARRACLDDAGSSSPCWRGLGGPRARATRPWASRAARAPRRPPRRSPGEGGAAWVGAPLRVEAAFTGRPAAFERAIGLPLASLRTRHGAARRGVASARCPVRETGLGKPPGDAVPQRCSEGQHDSAAVPRADLDQKIANWRRLMTPPRNWDIPVSARPENRDVPLSRRWVS